MISAFTARGLVVLRWSFRSEICVRANSPCQYIGTDLNVGKRGYLIGPYPMFSRHRTANPYTPTPMAMRMRRGAPSAVWWLACVSNNLCMQQPITCTARILARAFHAYVCSDVIRTAILNWGPSGRWTQSCVRLPAEPAFCAFSNTLCGMSHRDQHKTTSSRAVNALITNTWLEMEIWSSCEWLTLPLKCVSHLHSHNYANQIE